MKIFKTVKLVDILTKKERLLFWDWLLEEDYNDNCFAKEVLDSNLEYLGDNPNKSIEKIVKKIKNIMDGHDIDYFIFYS